MPLDGIWLDMNEISNYCSGDVCFDPGDPCHSVVMVSETTISWRCSTRISQSCMQPATAIPCSIVASWPCMQPWQTSMHACMHAGLQAAADEDKHA